MNADYITRVDIERLGHRSTTLFVRSFKQGWNEQSTADREEMVEGRIETLLDELKAQGFTVWMLDGNHGRALRGKTIRVDMIKQKDGSFLYRKFPEGWTARTPPMVEIVKTEAEAGEVLAWCRANGWTVRDWEQGFRCWKGPARPVHDKSTIISIRRNMQKDDPRWHYDLAFTW